MPAPAGVAGTRLPVMNPLEQGEVGALAKRQDVTGVVAAPVESGRADGNGAPRPGSRTSWTGRARSLVLGPQGGGANRRRASDVVRVVVAVIVVIISVPLVRANTSIEVHIAQLLTPP